MPLEKAQGIVIKGINVGEADKIVTLFTDRLGKVQAIAHGARKAKSRFMSSTQVFSYGEYVLYKGKSLYTISQSEVKESFQVVLGDLYTLTYCSYLVELLDALTVEDEKNIELFKLALKTLYIMTDSSIDRELLIRTFELKSMAISGYMPNLDRCCICGRNDSCLIMFSSKLGGLICGNCTNKDNYAIRVDSSTINTMRYILKSQIEKVRSLRISKLTKNDMKKILKNYIKYYLERDFKSLDFLDELEIIDNA